MIDLFLEKQANNHKSNMVEGLSSPLPERFESTDLAGS